MCPLCCNLNLYFHMRNHYKRIKNVKAKVDCSSPQSFRCFNPQCDESRRKRYSPRMIGLSSEESHITKRTNRNEKKILERPKRKNSDMNQIDKADKQGRTYSKDKNKGLKLPNEESIERDISSGNFTRRDSIRLQKEYTYFLLRILEDILQHPGITHQEVLELIESHIKANKEILNEDKMRTSARKMLKNILSDNKLNSENVSIISAEFSEKPYFQWSEDNKSIPDGLPLNENVINEMTNYFEEEKEETKNEENINESTNTLFLDKSCMLQRTSDQYNFGRKDSEKKNVQQKDLEITKKRNQEVQKYDSENLNIEKANSDLTRFQNIVLDNRFRRSKGDPFCICNKFNKVALKLTIDTEKDDDELVLINSPFCLTKNVLKKYCTPICLDDLLENYDKTEDDSNYMEEANYLTNTDKRNITILENGLKRFKEKSKENIGENEDFIDNNNNDNFFEKYKHFYIDRAVNTSDEQNVMIDKKPRGNFVQQTELDSGTKSTFFNVAEKDSAEENIIELTSFGNINSESRNISSEFYSIESKIEGNDQTEPLKSAQCPFTNKMVCEASQSFRNPIEESDQKDNKLLGVKKSNDQSISRKIEEKLRNFRALQNRFDDLPNKASDSMEEYSHDTNFEKKAKIL